MSSDTNKALVLASIEEAWNTGHLAIFDLLFDPDLVDHSVRSSLPATREGTKQLVTRYRSAFPDLHLTIEDQIAEGYKVVGMLQQLGVVSGPGAGASNG